MKNLVQQIEYDNKDSILSIRSNIKKNLTGLIKKYNIDNDTLAKCTGLSVATIASLRSRANNPTIMTLTPIAEFFNISVDNLISSDCVVKVKHKNQQNTINIPILDIAKLNVNLDHISLLSTQEDNKDEDEDEDSDNYITTSGNFNIHSYAVRLDSEILMPTYHKNTILIIDPDLKPSDSNIVLMSINNNYNKNSQYAKPTFRQVFIDSDEFYFKPINPEFGGIKVYSKYKIYGVVVRAIYDVV